MYGPVKNALFTSILYNLELWKDAYAKKLSMDSRLAEEAKISSKSKSLTWMEHCATNLALFQINIRRSLSSSIIPLITCHRRQKLDLGYRCTFTQQSLYAPTAGHRVASPWPRTCWCSTTPSPRLPSLKAALSHPATSISYYLVTSLFFDSHFCEERSHPRKARWPSCATRWFGNRHRPLPQQLSPLHPSTCL